MPKAKSKKRTKRPRPTPRHNIPTTHASRPISLPLDVLRQICGFSSNSPDTLANLARTCKDLYQIATPTLYADVHLKSDEQVERLLDSLADEAVGKALRMGGRVTRSGSLGSVQTAAIARLELLQSTTKITFEFVPLRYDVRPAASHRRQAPPILALRQCIEHALRFAHGKEPARHASFVANRFRS
ncbi:hypothetical protein JCM24511_05700 [Saitozyma sp. JCM 24511]|nr:hypothetical protein JCM24511_05700 [Saitozyma sp. JCM 24511]